MPGLVLKLAPNERVLINGAVIENGDRRSKISVMTPNANILRMRDAIHPDSINTPVSRTCYIAQLMISGDADADEGHRQLVTGIEQLSQVFEDHDSRNLLADATSATLEGNYYQALRSLKGLLAREARLFSLRGI